MTRRRQPAPAIGHGPITARIIQGPWTARPFPGSPAFAAHCQQLALAFAGARPRARKQPLATLLAVVEERSWILDRLHPRNDAVVALLCAIGARADRWVRSPLDWEPDLAVPEREQVSDLIRHLFERYPTPRFFESCWWPDRRVRGRAWVELGWYVHVAGGGSIRTAPGLPTVMSRRAAHELGAAPAWLTPSMALRWAQTRALGASVALCEVLSRTRSFCDFGDDELWLPLYAKLAGDATLRLHDVHPLIDYVWHQRHGVPGGGAFTVNGHTVASLLRAMARWHEALGRRRAHPGPACAWDGLSGAAPLHEIEGDVSWTLEEICGSERLREESAEMRHCVAIYASACVAGTTSIWSLRARDPLREVVRATIRVNVQTREVVEARSFANRPISPAAASVIRRWSARHHLRLGHLTVA